jgi:hypothetical protein
LEAMPLPAPEDVRRLAPLANRKARKSELDRAFHRLYRGDSGIG